MKADHPRHRWRGKIILALVVICVISILVQVFWPGKRFMAFTEIGGVDVAGLNLDEARARVSEVFADHTLRIESETGELISTAKVPLDQIAVDAMISEELEYPLWQRLIPFSAFIRIFGSHWVGAAVNLDVESVSAAIPETPTDAHISIVDGQTTVVKASNGFVINHAELAKRLSELRIDADGETTLQIPADVTPPAVSDSDIAAFVAKSPDQLTATIAATFQGTGLAISAASVDGTWDLSTGEQAIWTSASTYKLYIAYYVLKKVDAGEITYESIQLCLERMIVNSDNACPERWLAQYGFTAINATVRSIDGIGGTSFAVNDMRTTARDLRTFLQKLYAQELLSETSTIRLLDLMKRQTYRDGIPAGVGSNPVADKVGFLYGYLHDAAIVYSDSGDYILVILTDGSSWTNIAELAGVINSFNTK